jgi:hypothetical protein
MRLDVTGRARLRSARDEALGVRAEHVDGISDGVAHIPDEQQQAWQHASTEKAWNKGGVCQRSCRVTSSCLL